MRRRALILAAVAALLSIGLFTAGGWVGPLYMVPVMLLAGLLVCGRFPGEELLVRAAKRRRARGRSPAAGVPHRRRRPPYALTPRGGSLLASALAGRAPPARSHVWR